jgi:hypothetical protein
MKGVLIVLATLLGLVVLVAIIGMLVPRDHVAGVTITLRQPPDSVWKVVRDLGGVPRWWGDMKRSERATGADGRERWTQDVGASPWWPSSRPTSHRDTSSPGSTRRPMHRSVERGPRHHPVDSGSKFTVTERGWIANPVFRFMSRFIFGYYGTQERYLRALGKRFGEEVTPARLPPE